MAEWKAAVAAVRSGKLLAPQGLPVKSADIQSTVKVTSRPITQVTPNDNPIVIAEQQQKQTPSALASAA